VQSQVFQNRGLYLLIEELQDLLVRKVLQVLLVRKGLLVRKVFKET
jgi:hypothetical protein